MTMIGLWGVVRCASMADMYTLARDEGDRVVEIHHGNEVYDT